MLLPLAMWVGLRLVFFHGIGGTYVTADYSPFVAFLELTGWKLAHLHHLLVQQDIMAAEGPWAIVDRVTRIGTALLIGLLLLLWMARGLVAGFRWLARVGRKGDLPATDASLLLTMWAALSLAFYFALALPSTRYATSVAMFVWPALMNEVVTRGKALLRFGIVACLALSLARTSQLLLEWNPPSPDSDLGQFQSAEAKMSAALRQVPANITEIYVLNGGWLVTASPNYLRAFLDVPAEIVRLVDIRSSCKEVAPFVAVDHVIRAGMVTVNAELPACASFFFNLAGPASIAVVDGGLSRSDGISYELPQAHSVVPQGPFEPLLDLGHRITVHIRPSGPARFIYEPAAPAGDLAWFDTP